MKTIVLSSLALIAAFASVTAASAAGPLTLVGKNYVPAVSVRLSRIAAKPALSPECSVPVRGAGAVLLVGKRYVPAASVTPDCMMWLSDCSAMKNCPMHSANCPA